LWHALVFLLTCPSQVWCRSTLRSRFAARAQVLCLSYPASRDHSTGPAISFYFNVGPEEVVPDRNLCFQLYAGPGSIAAAPSRAQTFAAFKASYLARRWYWSYSPTPSGNPQKNCWQPLHVG